MVKKHNFILSLVLILSLNFLILAVSAETEIIRPSLKDTYVDQINPTTNHGNVPSSQVNQNLTQLQRSLLQFDLSAIPPEAQITSATLKLYVEYTSADGRTYCVYRVTQSWTENGATWQTYDGTNNWASPGGDYTLEGGACLTVPSQNNWMNWTVTDIVKAWIEDSEPNYGFLIKDNAEGVYQVNYMSQLSSREKAPQTLRPILEVNYIIPEEQVEPVGGELLSNNLVSFIP
jgi:hypothetical protein